MGSSILMGLRERHNISRISILIMNKLFVAVVLFGAVYGDGGSHAHAPAASSGYAAPRTPMPALPLSMPPLNTPPRPPPTTPRPTSRPTTPPPTSPPPAMRFLLPPTRLPTLDWTST